MVLFEIYQFLLYVQYGCMKTSITPTIRYGISQIWHVVHDAFIQKNIDLPFGCRSVEEPLTCQLKDAEFSESRLQPFASNSCIIHLEISDIF